jgi:imidazolonepropionase-like amidohydrolase
VEDDPEDGGVMRPEVAMRKNHERRSSRRALLLSVLLLGVGCAIPGLQRQGRVPPDKSGASDPPSAQLLRQQLEDDARLDNAGYPLLRAAAARCAESMPRTGLRLFNAQGVSGPWQGFARDAGYTDSLEVQAVAKGSGAATAGLRIGDHLIALDGTGVPLGARAIETVRARLAAAEARGASSVAATFRRDGKDQAITLPVEKSCAVRLMSWRQDAPDAWSDGRTIAVTTGMMTFAATDAELAVLLAHEIAHADLQRRAERSTWESLMHGATAATETVVGIASNDRFMRMRGARPDAPWDAATERAADERTIAILRAAGAPSANVHAFWRRALLPDPSEFPYMRAHPMSMERILWLEALEKGTGPVGTTSAVQSSSAGQTALRFGALVDGSGTLVRDAVIVVNGERIVSVGSGDGAVPAGATVRDLRRFTAIPGMVDVHTHMSFWRSRDNPLGTGVTRNKDSVVMLAAENLRKTLETGVTTVRDLGASNYVDIALRDSVNKGAMIGPRMLVVGYGLSRATAGRAGGPPVRSPATGRIVDTLDIPEAIRTQVAAGADWIKMYGSTGTYANVTGRQTFTDREMQVAVNAAHALGKRIAIHSYGDSGGRAAMRAGAESVEHVAGMADATLAEWAKRGTYYVPTIDHNRFYAENAPLLGYTAEQVAGLDSFRLLNLETARRAIKNGVKIAMGSDAVYWMFGENTRELGWFVKAGMTPAQALAAATIGGAELLGMSDRIGKIAPGYFADVVAVEGNPLTDIDVVISKVRWVMKGGAVVVDRSTPR